MKTGFVAMALVSGLSLAAHAQQAPPSAAAAAAAAASGGVQTSTDPARAAAVEKQAREIGANAGGPSKVFFRGKTDTGLAILSGGNTVGDRVTMHAERNAYRLWVATVSKPSGAYLADARLRIVHTGNKSVVLERQMEGPWLMAALPAGKYEVSAIYKADAASKEQTLSNRVTVPESGQRQVVLRFATTDTVSSEMDRPFKGNPFGVPAIKK